MCQPLTMGRVRRDAASAAWVFLLGAGCGGGSSPEALPDSAAALTDISGWYQVTTDLEGACGAPTASSLAPAYVWVERLQSTFYVHACSATAPSDCTGTMFYDFTKPIDTGLTAEGGGAFFSAGCTLTYERATATLAGDVLSVRSLKYSINESVPQSECTLAAARALTGPCTYEIDLTASRI
jgi:hypothetical protein